MHTVATGILVPFLGTSLGSACVFFLKNELNENVQRFMTGFAAGVMTAASVWSLLIPALEQAADMGAFAFVPFSAAARSCHTASASFCRRA